MLSSRLEDLEDQLIDVDASASTGRSRVLGAAMRPVPSCTDVVSRARARVDEPFSFEGLVRSHRSRWTEPSLAAQGPNRRHAIACAQRAVADEIRKFRGKLAITSHSSCAITLHGVRSHDAEPPAYQE